MKLLHSKKALALGFAVLFNCTMLLAQKTVTGKVISEETGKPVEGATVAIKGSKQSAITNEKGEFSLNVAKETDVLVISFVGMTKQEVKVAEKSAFAISLRSDNSNLDDVVVVGYGTQRAKTVTGSVAVIDLKKIEDLPITSITEGLRGQVPGLNVSGGSQRPGAMASLNIRQQFGLGKDNFSELPLVIIDDVMQLDPQTGKATLDRFNQLDMSEVESITVLRDASAAIYGSRATQGAIIVKTKRGKAGPPKVNYTGKFQTNDAVSHGKVMNARQYGEFANKFGRALGWNVNNLYTDSELNAMDSLNYDWLMNDWRAANNMQHSIDVSGGTERATFFTGGSYFKQGANLGAQDFDRWTFRAGSEVKLSTNLKFNAVVGASNTFNEKSFTKVSFSDGSYAIGGEQNDYNVLLHMPKYVPWIYNINGVDQYVSPPLGPNKLGNVSGNNSISNWNYYALLNNGSKTTNKNFNYNANFSLQYEVPFIKGLTVKANYGLSQNAGNTEQIFMPVTLSRALTNTTDNHIYSSATRWDAPVLNRSNSRVTYDNTTGTNKQYNFFVTYDKKIADHNISAMFSTEKSTAEWERRYQIYDNPIPGAYNGTSVSAGTLNSGNTITYRTESGNLSYLGRVSYNYKSKYMLQFVFRWDASTVFAPENYWGFFPGISAGWVVSDEDWFKNNVAWVDFLKVRGSFGMTGNNNINAWKWMQLYTAETDKGMGFGTSGGLYTTGITPGVTPNRDAKWDKTYQRNLGLDMSFLRNRLSVTLDGYINKSVDMLTDMSGAINVPISVGGAFAEQNYSSIKYWGSEISVTWKDRIRDFNYSVNMNFGYSDNKVLKYIEKNYDYPSIMMNGTPRIGQSTIAPVWGFRTWKGTSQGDGMLRTDADIDNYWNYLTELANNSGVPGAAPRFLNISDKSGLRKGMLVYEDVAGQVDTKTGEVAAPNGMIVASQDYVKLRKSSRTYGVSTNLSASWKGISLSAQIATSWGGGNFLDYIKQGTSSTHSLWSHPVYLTDMFDPETNPNGKYPNLAYYDAFGGNKSDYFMLPDFRCFVRSLSIGYNIPKKASQVLKIENARVFVTGFNLWDFYNPYPNKYRNMYDAPQVGYPTLRTWALGVNLGF
ncbi:SusC/RagA family TonB-linked outer membrane protein [Polluticaenibacter yanchengensis]|uniref:SusC/RagA family TonB-linked outer membrane protein n=1 Tax=Polluticaenibacter yanchengensis TaxID=3014562 RepID=A0ABT4UN99_9BACT|nr:SusC/RagA family TonB-linked outer membrane protein [Chitinophagaceae bacterium LY-5]